MEKLYLSPNIQVEPLIDQWYSWSHLIPPATAARNLTERHIRIMESYVSAPHVHAAAVKNPKLSGGPFMDYGDNRAEEIRELLSRTVARNAHLIQLSSALQELDQLLRTQATGESLQALYSEIPQPLKGYVELIYDRHNNASYRLIEPLIYQSRFYRTDSQSLTLSRIAGDDRPFVLSTPRLAEKNLLHLQVPFNDEAIDTLFRTKVDPLPFGDLCESCHLPPDDQALFHSFFTVNPPHKYSPYHGTGLRWRYFGHACILIESAGISVLFDPVLSYTYESHVARYTYADLPDMLDYVIITHNHQDHVLLETLLQIRHRVRHIIVPRSGGGVLEDPSLRLTLGAIGFTNIIELDEFQSVQFAGGSVVGLPFLGEHADLNIRSKLAYVLEIQHTKLLFAADSCNLAPRALSSYSRMHRRCESSVYWNGMRWCTPDLALRPIDVPAP